MVLLTAPERLAAQKTGHAVSYESKCMECGFCISACPTHALLDDEPDGPRGRVAISQDLLYGDGPVSEKAVLHMDRCLSCLACTRSCPYGVDHMHLFDRARSHIEEHYKRPPAERALRSLLAFLLPSPSAFRLSLLCSRPGRMFRAVLPTRVRNLVDMAPSHVPSPSAWDRPQVFPAEGERRMRAALMTGCVQRVLRPSINEATVRLLTRHGCEVVVPAGIGCCGALALHMGKERQARKAARGNVAAWRRLEADSELDALVVNASGCGTTVKDYVSLLAADAESSRPAARISHIAKDVTEVVHQLGLKEPVGGTPAHVVYHTPCSLQHGQGIVQTPVQLLADAGFDVSRPREAHLCCGSAGTYSLMQPEISDRLGTRAAANLTDTGASIIATGNIGCQVQIARFAALPTVHTVELLDWATGGPRPSGV